MERYHKSADRFFLLSFAVLLIFGLILLASVSGPIGYTKFGDTLFFIKKQILFGVLPGVVFFLILAKINYQTWMKFGGLAYVFAVGMLCMVFIPGLGLTINGSRSWVSLGGFSFQPAEFAKLAIIIMLAKILSEKTDLKDWKNGLLPVLAIVSPAVLLVVAQPDVGTLSIFLVIIYAMLYLAGTPKIYLLILALIGIGSFAVLLLIAPYRVDRLMTFLHPELDPRGVGYQINQAYLAVGSGGVWGLGLGHSRQKFQYLPEAQADSIFAVVAEEMGLLKTGFLVLLITFLALRGFRIASGSPDKFGRLLAAGIMIWFIWQSFLNIGTIIGLLPLTGVPLPFISHGGTAMLIGLASIGIVVNISKFSSIK